MTSKVNILINNIDIDLSGLSNGEGWNLPAFNATALGKWSIVSNCRALTKIGRQKRMPYLLTQ